MDYTIHVPGTQSPDVVVTRSMLGNLSVRAGGAPVPRIGRSGQRYAIPLGDGSTEELTLTGQWQGLKAVTRGETIQLERPLAIWELVLAVLPISLVGFGGALGGGLGGLFSALNLEAMRRVDSAPVRVILPIATTVAAFAIYFLVVRVLLGR